MKKHSAVACISRADLFSSLSSDALKKIAAISTHQEYFPRNTIIRQPGDGKEGMIFMDEIRMSAQLIVMIFKTCLKRRQI